VRQTSLLTLKDESLNRIRTIAAYKVLNLERIVLHPAVDRLLGRRTNWAVGNIETLSFYVWQNEQPYSLVLLERQAMMRTHRFRELCASARLMRSC